MGSTLTKVLLAAIAASFLVACTKKQEVAPNPTPPVKVEAPVPAQEPAAPAAVPSAIYAGEWKGDSGPDLPISFSIEGNQVTSLNASYAGKNGNCSFNGNIGSDGPAAITDKSFTSKGRSTQEEIEFTATGTLTSNTEASGTLFWKGKSSLCGDINLEYKWTAKKEPAEPAEPI